MSYTNDNLNASLGFLSVCGVVFICFYRASVSEIIDHSFIL